MTRLTDFINRKIDLVFIILMHFTRKPVITVQSTFVRNTISTKMTLVSDQRKSSRVPRSLCSEIYICSSTGIWCTLTGTTKNIRYRRVNNRVKISRIYWTINCSTILKYVFTSNNRFRLNITIWICRMFWFHFIRWHKILSILTTQ